MTSKRDRAEAGFLIVSSVGIAWICIDILIRNGVLSREVRLVTLLSSTMTYVGLCGLVVVLMATMIVAHMRTLDD